MVLIHWLTDSLDVRSWRDRMGRVCRCALGVAAQTSMCDRRQPRHSKIWSPG